MGNRFLVPTVNPAGMTLLSTTTLSGASVTIGSIPATYNHLQLIVRNFKPSGDGADLRVRFNSDSNTRYRTTQVVSTENLTFNDTALTLSNSQDNSVATNLIILNVFDYSNTSTWKFAEGRGLTVNYNTDTNLNLNALLFAYNQTSAISSIVLFPNSGNFTSGTAYLYGVK